MDAKPNDELIYAVGRSAIIKSEEITQKNTSNPGAYYIRPF